MNKSLNDFQFNDYIFLNTDFLESFVSQRYNGFPKEMQILMGAEYASSYNGAKKTTGANAGAKIGNDFLGGHGTYGETNEGEQFNQSNTETSQNIISKLQKDNMFNDFVEYIKPKEITSPSSLETVLGSYVKLCAAFCYMDFERIHKLCDEKYRKTFYENSENKKDFSYESFCDIKEKIAFLQDLIPFDAVMFNQDFMILIDKNWMRIKKEHLGFILDGKINIIGKVNKVFEPQNDDPSTPKVIKILNNIQEYTLSLLNELGFLKSDNVCIVTPIAIYR